MCPLPSKNVSLLYQALDYVHSTHICKGSQIHTRATMDGNIKEQDEPEREVAQSTCCGCCTEYHPPTEITASSDQITIEDSCKQDLDIFLSSLAQPPPGGIQQDMGLISVIVGKIRNVSVRRVGAPHIWQQKQLEADMAEMERARGLAFAKLRKKAKQLDANAILNIKVDLEAVGQASIIYASGNAVVLNKAPPTGTAQWGGHDVPPYLPWAETAAAQPGERNPLALEMNREAKS